MLHLRFRLCWQQPGTDEKFHLSPGRQLGSRRQHIVLDKRLRGSDAGWAPAAAGGSASGFYYWQAVVWACREQPCMNAACLTWCWAIFMEITQFVHVADTIQWMLESMLGCSQLY